MSINDINNNVIIILILLILNDINEILILILILIIINDNINEMKSNNNDIMIMK